MKFCKDCEYYLQPINQKLYARCYHESSAYIDMVTGEEEAKFTCETMRDAVNYCDNKAKFFKEKQ